MATREKRLAQFDGEGQPPPDLPVQVLCEDQSGTYELPFACRFTPTCSSWLNQIERWFALIMQRAIRRGSFRSEYPSVIMQVAYCCP